MDGYYPGDQYIDWIGVSCYGPAEVQEGWFLLTDMMDVAYPAIAAISSTKPIALLEFGVFDEPAVGSKAEWITDAFDAIKDGRYPRITAVSWWHESWDESDLRIDSSAEALAAYQSAVADPFFVAEPAFSVPLTSADFTWTPTVPEVDQEVSFLDQSNGSPTSWSWVFGDGGTSELENPTHTYTASGTYTVELSVSDGLDSASASKDIVVQDADETPPLTDPGDYVYVIDASAKVAGAQGTNWLTDVVLNNAETGPANAHLFFLERGMNNRDAQGVGVTVPAESSLKHQDVVASVFGRGNTAGAIVIGSELPLIVTSRTYNDQGESGTYGQFIPAFAAEQALGPVEPARLVQLIANSDFRTNIGFVNFTDQLITIEVEVFHGSGESIDDVVFDLQPFEYYQETDIIGDLTSDDVDDAYAVVVCDTADARYFAYASVIDNRSGDPVFIGAVSESAR